MNKNLNDAINAVERADALLCAIESCYLAFDILPDEMERANKQGSADILRTLGCRAVGEGSTGQAGRRPKSG